MRQKVKMNLDPASVPTFCRQKGDTINKMSKVPPSLYESPPSVLKSRHYGLGPYVTSMHGGDWGSLLDSWDIFYPTSTWPIQYKQLFYRTHKNYRERFKLFMFFWGNGLPPMLAGNLVFLASGYQDDSARNHVTSLIKDVGSPKGNRWYIPYSFERRTPQLGEPGGHMFKRLRHT